MESVPPRLYGGTERIVSYLTEELVRQGHEVTLFASGDSQTAADLVAAAPRALRLEAAIGDPLPYVALQQLLDEGNAWGFYGYEKSAYFETLTDEVIDVIAGHAPLKSSPLSVLLFYRLDQAYTEMGENDTAFGGGRTARSMGFFIGLCPTAEMLPAERQWVRSLWDALHPHMMNDGTYINALTEADEHRIRATYGAKYDRLAEVKAKYDPGNVFHRNANIK